VGIRHIPANSPFGALDIRFAGRVGDNRWNQAGDPTLCIASDKRVALGEFARHFREPQDPTVGPLAIERAVFQLDVRQRRCSFRRWHSSKMRSAGTWCSFLEKLASDLSEFITVTPAGSVRVAPQSRSRTSNP
jgi:hypothetical protein